MRQVIPRLHLISSCVAMILLQALLGKLYSQTTIVKDSPYIKGTTVVIPGIEYKRSAYHNFFWGEHYRKEWSTPIRVKNFYLDTAKGGLTPVREGGGRQTNTLHLINAQGKQYVLRSVNKDFSRALDNMEGTFISRVAKDQVSIGHPYAAITITPMIKAAGIYHTTPEVVFVPKQDALGKYNEEYGDKLYLFEERPDENQEDADNFGNAKNVVGSDKLMEEVYEESDDYVDQQAFVRARLFDMVIGDWGRHPDNWRWAEFDLGKQNVYRPVPRDRDQAYTKIDGLYPDIAGSIPDLRQIQGFGFSIKNIGAWNFPGRPLDQKFLNELDLAVWIQQAKELQQVLTDSLIENSIRLMPPELFAISGATIIAKLKSRRNELQRYAKEYYEYLAKTVTILGSEKTEMIEINVLPGEKVEVDISKINKHGNIIDTPYYSRRFNASETKDIFIYGLGKKDLIALKGERKNNISIRIIDPEDKDSIYSTGADKIKDIKFYTGKKFEYDTVRDEKIDINIIPVFTPSAYKVYDHDPMDLFGRTGIKISGGVVFRPQPWRKKKYQIVHSIHVLHGFLRKTLNIGYVGRFSRAVGKWDIVLKGRIDDPAVENYFGTGNNAVFQNKTNNYYRTLSQRFYGGVGIEKDWDKRHHAEATLIWQSVKYRKQSNRFIANAAHIDPSIFKHKNFAGVEAGYRYDQTNGALCPTRGFTFNFGGGFLKNFTDTGSFAKFNSAIAFYQPLSNKFIFAIRAGGSTLFGKPDFYHLNRLGGNAELRGYERERFYGKSGFYTNTELRWITNTRNYLFNGKAGLIAFYDIGRVWMPEETSSLWHDGYGMGVVIIPFNKIALTATYGLSSEGDNLFFSAGMFF